MDTIIREDRGQSELSAELIDRIRELWRQRLTIPQIAERIGWPEGKSTAVLRRMTREMTKRMIRDAPANDQVVKRHVGCLYGGRW